MPATGAVGLPWAGWLGRWWRCWGAVVEVEEGVVGEGGVWQLAVPMRWQERWVQINAGSRAGCGSYCVEWLWWWLYAGWVLLCVGKLDRNRVRGCS